MREMIIQAVRQARAGSHTLILVFKPDGVRGAAALLEMQEVGQVELSDDAMVDLWCIAHAGKWVHDYFRTVRVVLTEHFDEARFVQEMEDVLEAIEAADSA